MSAVEAYTAIADDIGVTPEQVAKVDRLRHSARPILQPLDLKIEAALKAHDKEIRRG